MDAICYTEATLASFLLYILYHHEPGTLLIVCSERRTFVQKLLKSIEKHQEETQQHSNSMNNQDEGGDSNADTPETSPIHPPPHPLLTRTLQVLAASQTVKLAFCSSVQVLRAYLTSMARPMSSGGERKATSSVHSPTLALINPVSLHRETASYSAQKISEMLAATVEASLQIGVRLVVVETSDQQVASHPPDNAGEVAVADPESRGEGEMVAEGQWEPAAADHDPYKEDVPILSASTKLFGMSGERTIMNRTVKIEDVVRRWCRFEVLPNSL